MYLRSLVLKGFKSFPERTHLEFGPGVSVVIGPNGSGKSNITDAVLWVLGEQSPPRARGSRSSSRRPRRPAAPQQNAFIPSAPADPGSAAGARFER